MGREMRSYVIGRLRRRRVCLRRLHTHRHEAGPAAGKGMRDGGWDTHSSRRARVRGRYACMLVSSAGTRYTSCANVAFDCGRRRGLEADADGGSNNGLEVVKRWVCRRI